MTEKVELTKEARAQAIASIQRYFEENLEGPIGNLPAGHLLDFFLEEIGPAIYNRTIADAQQRVMDLNGELFADEFQYWVRQAARRRARK